MLDLRRLLISGSLALPLACSDGPPDEHASGATADAPAGRTLTVRAGTSSLPDADVDHVYVDVDRVALLYEGENEPRTVGTDLTFDLIELVNGRDATLGTATRARRVKSVRVDVSCAEMHLADGTIIERRFPRHGPARLELSAKHALDTAEVLVQFDVDHSLFRVDEHGAEPERVLVHLAARVLDGTQLTTIGGHVMDDPGTPENPHDDRPIANTPIVLEQGGLLVARSRTDGDGGYAFVGPYAGDYDVVCLPEARTPDARAIHAKGPSVLGDEDFLFQIAESEEW